MKKSFAKSHPRILTGAVALLFATGMNAAHAGTFTWGGVTGNFSDPSKWVGNSAPLGTDPTDVLIFAGDVAPTPYTATSNSGTNPFLFNQLNFQGINATPGTGAVQTIDGATTLLFGGTNPTLTQSGSASLVIAAPILLGANLTFAGSTVANDAAHDKATITLNGTLSGNYNITKNDTSTFRFGSASGFAVSDNKWFGTLTINDGTIRFNNNAYTAPTALRSNPVVLTSATALLTTQFKTLGVASNSLDPDSSLRFGTLSGTAGTVEARRETATAGVFDSADITITTLSSGSYAGALRNVQTGGSNSGVLNIRGVGTQTFTGTVNVSRDVRIGDLATLVLAGSTTLDDAQIVGAVILGGGRLRIDNSTTPSPSRLRDGSSNNTGVETIGGGTLSLVGNSVGSTENVGRLQLGGGQPRSGALTLNVTHSAASALTILNFQSYARDNPGAPADTVNFTANNAGGTPIALGTGAANGPRITFNVSVGNGFAVPVFNGLLGNTALGDATSVGWATVNGTDFASYGASGVTAVTTVALPNPVLAGDNTANIALTGAVALSNVAGYAVNSIKMTPAAPGAALDLASSGSLLTNAFLLAGTTDYAITATGGGTIANAGGVSARYFHVASAMLTVDAGVGGVQAPLVKAGAGALVLTNPANNLVTLPVTINEGTLRATPGTSLPAGELRFRGGVLEITGGGTFSRQLGLGTGKLTWSGVRVVSSVDTQVGEEQGSGGFAAVGQNATVDLTPLAGTDFTWEDIGFVNSGHALVFGSTRADARITWVDNINLTSVAQAVNYNARQFRAIDNPNSNADVAVLSGTISGTVRNDLMKTGNGDLILTGNNTYNGATLITDGTLRVNGSTANSFLTDVRDGGTLGGNGTVAGVQVENNGTLAPGDLKGNASILNTASLAFAGSGAKLTIELGGTTAGGNNTSGYDRVNVTGGITLAGAQLTGSLLNGFNASLANLFFILINDGADAVQGVFAQGSAVTIGTQTFTIGYTGNADTNSFTGGNDVVLRLVPEPGAAALLLLGTLGLAMRRRRA